MITVKYSCEKCGLVDQAVEVPAREGVHVNLKDWMEQVSQTLDDDHTVRSPGCEVESFQNVKFRAPREAEFIGQQVE